MHTPNSFDSENKALFFLAHFNIVFQKVRINSLSFPLALSTKRAILWPIDDQHIIYCKIENITRTRLSNLHIGCFRYLHPVIETDQSLRLEGC